MMANAKHGLLGRGIVLVAVPLGMQILLALVLLWNLIQLNEQSTRETFVREMLTQTYSVCIGVPELAALMMLQRQTLGLLDEGVVLKHLHVIDKRIVNLENLARSSPKQLNNVKRLEIGRKALNTAILEAPELESLEQNRSVKEKMLAQTSSLFNALSDMVHVEKAQLAIEPGARENLRKVLGASLLLWVLATILVSVYLARFYARTIRNPLQHLAENARLLAKRLPLKYELEAKDEISSLDRILHSVDANLKVAHRNEELLVQNAADMICSISSNLEIIRMNSTSLHLVGVEAKELEGKTVLDLFHGASIEAFQREMQKTKLEKQNRFEIAMAQAQGTTITTLWSAIWSDYEHAYFCVIHDLTEQKRLEIVKQEFIEMISNDLKVPLALTLEGINRLSAGEKSTLSDEERSELKTVDQNLRWLIDLVNDLLDFEQLQAGRMRFNLEEQSLPELINAGISLVNELASQKSVKIIANEKRARILADRSRFIQLIVNLLANAIKFSPMNGCIMIDIEEQTDRQLKISISDEGPGIPENYLETIFAPFVQAQDRSSMTQDGIGLGLAISKMIVEGHNAVLSVQNLEPHGSRFCISINSIEA
ncbi:MAG: PAS domain S-box protein [Candidatus Obscuribacterales bacterium]|nr:PAS domain S-box protein [Candidatus Obscuribacterales bacterium]